MPFLLHQSWALAASAALPTLLLVAEPLSFLVHTVLAQLTAMAEICDAGTPHRKEPAGYAEAGPSGPMQGPVRPT